MKSVTFVDKNLYTKKLKALSKYFRKTYKYLRFEVIPQLAKENKKDGYYELDLPTETLFEKVYGKLILRFYVQNDVAVIEDIEPNRILLDCYKRELELYNGIPYATKKDLDKIKIMEKLL